MTDQTTQARLEYLRAELRAERLSYGELAELQGLAAHIDPSDVELLEAAGVPEFDDDDVEYVVENDGSYHRLQDDDGRDVVSVQEHGDGNAYVIVYTGKDGVAWEGLIALPR